MRLDKLTKIQINTPQLLINGERVSFLDRSALTLDVIKKAGLFSTTSEINPHLLLQELKQNMELGLEYYLNMPLVNLLTDDHVADWSIDPQLYKFLRGKVSEYTPGKREPKIIATFKEYWNNQEYQTKIRDKFLAEIFENNRFLQYKYSHNNVLAAYEPNNPTSRHIDIEGAGDTNYAVFRVFHNGNTKDGELVCDEYLVVRETGEVIIAPNGIGEFFGTRGGRYPVDTAEVIGQYRNQMKEEMHTAVEHIGTTVGKTVQGMLSTK